MRKMMILLLAMFFALGAFAASPQSGGTSKEATASKNAPKQDRVSGTIARSNKEKSTLTIKEHKSDIERIVFYNDSTKWTKGAAPAEMKEFKDGSRVVCVGKKNEKGELTATRIELQP